LALSEGTPDFKQVEIIKTAFSMGWKAAPKGAREKEEMYAVIKTGGKQYRVATNDKILIEKLEGSAGDQVTFSDVLLVANGASVDIGAPLVSGATVVGEIAAQEKADTVYIFKKRRRKHYRRRNGHRQLLTSVTITDILTGGAKPAAKAQSESKAEQPAAAPVTAAAAIGDGKSDDISLIGGIGPKMEAGMRELGYHTFAAIAAMSAEDIEKAETHLKQKGRFAREEWIEQAKELLDGKPPRAKTDRARS
jgi:large subunit ribosomal protein L21